MPMFLRTNVFELVTDRSTYCSLGRWFETIKGKRSFVGDYKEFHLYIEPEDYPEDRPLEMMVDLERFIWELMRSGIPAASMHIEYGHRHLSQGTIGGEDRQAIIDACRPRRAHTYGTLMLRPLLEEYGLSIESNLIERYVYVHQVAISRQH